MYHLFRPLLFKLDPETAHSLTLNLVRLAGVFHPARWLLEALYAVPVKRVEAFGLTFKNPLGLAAGYDKDGVAIRGLSALGFGHLEIGTVTLRPQPGNPKPRIFRLIEDEAIINRMGFPGTGMDFVMMSLRGARRSSSRGVAYRDPGRRGNLSLNGEESHNWRLPRRTDTIIGVNLGKNADTPLEEAVNDYVLLVKAFAPLADYLAVNVSSPNTIGLRRLQGREMLESLLGQIATERIKSKRSCPVLVKLGPDLTDAELDDALEVILWAKMDGVIATNTSLGRKGLQSMTQEETGGLSGRPLAACSEAILGKIVKRLDGRLPVISVGGIMSPQDARRRLNMGAALVQVYTGLVYHGPGLIKNILQSL